MADTKELFEKLQNDPEFFQQFTDLIKARREAGASNYYETVIPVAAEYGYEVKPEELDAIYAVQMEELSEEELGKVSGGISCLTALCVSSAFVTLLGLTLGINYTLDVIEGK